jgi:hypothetical protein
MQRKRGSLSREQEARRHGRRGVVEKIGWIRVQRQEASLNARTGALALRAFLEPSRKLRVTLVIHTQIGGLEVWKFITLTPRSSSPTANCSSSSSSTRSSFMDYHSSDTA